MNKKIEKTDSKKVEKNESKNLNQKIMQITKFSMTLISANKEQREILKNLGLIQQ